MSTLGAQDTTAAPASYHSPETERLLAGAMLSEDHCHEHHALLAHLAPEDFYLEEHQNIWRLCGQLADVGRPHDPASVMDAAERMQLFIGGAQYLVDLLHAPMLRAASARALTSAADRVKGFSLTRKLEATLRQALSLTQTGQDFGAVAGFVEDDLSNLRKLSSTSQAGPRHIASFYVRVADRITAKIDGQDGNDVVPTGFPELDNSLGGGLTRGQLIVIAGRPGMGKTSFAVAVEDNISRSGTPTLTFELEMPGTAIAQRKLGKRTRISFSELKKAELSDDQLLNLVETIEANKDEPTYIDDTPGLTLREVRARARAWAREHPNGVIFLDYLQKIAPGREGNDPRRTVSESSEGLLQLALELHVPVVALAQLNRGLEARTNKRPVMSDLRESGQIEQDAAVIIFLYRDEVYNPDSNERGITEAIQGKNRDDQPVVVKFHSDLGTTTYQEMGAWGTDT